MFINPFDNHVFQHDLAVPFRRLSAGGRDAILAANGGVDEAED